MKKQQIYRLFACFALALCNFSLMAQGIIVYKKNGTQVKFSYETIDSIVPVICSASKPPVNASGIVNRTMNGESRLWNCATIMR